MANATAETNVLLAGTEKSAGSHVTNATSAAALNVVCPVGTVAVEVYAESSWYCKRGSDAAATNTLRPAGFAVVPINCRTAAGVLSILVTSASNTRVDATPVG